ncbi:GntR family transcriptional regulator [Variovorax dokdonensis]|uniref:GntR family transcriptional regulator n=1 Tax=Variovorax dokdonensis TaxID=344883 RepID=A0ABT7N919_9BURK|nr:GntR family transcriptional regulator [Variovorax dokdonensis]MDM0044421.1 GntR family transcriptional regulator [Variovorax dokdonensis]
MALGTNPSVAINAREAAHLESAAANANDMSRNPSSISEDTQGSTLASMVFERLREDILEGQWPPGEKLRIETLQEHYQVGASPIREALNRLTSVRLVELVDRRGFRVATLSDADLLELIHARKLLNELVVRESLLHADDAWEEAVVFAYHRMWRCPMTTESGQTNREWELLHRKFHAAVIAACPSKWLLDFHEQLFDCADRHRRRNVRQLDAEFTRMEHREIMEAAVSRDVPLTIKLLNDSIDTLVTQREQEAGGTARARPEPARSSAREL